MPEERRKVYPSERRDSLSIYKPGEKKRLRRGNHNCMNFLPLQTKREKGAYFHNSVRTGEKVSLTRNRGQVKRILSIILDNRGKATVQQRVWEYCKKPVSKNIGNYSGSFQSITKLHSDYS